MSYTIDNTTYRSPNYNSRAGAPVDSIVIHTTEGHWPSDAQWMCNPASGVSTHFVIPPTGTVIYQLVAPSLRAWHAGESSYNGRSNWNDFSIGLEISHVHGQAWPHSQQEIFAALARDLIAQYHIPQANVVAHRWIAPDRKSDPSDWTDAQLEAWIASLYAPTSMRVVALGVPVYQREDCTGPLWGHLADGEVVTVDKVYDGQRAHLADGRGFIKLDASVAIVP